MQGCTLQEGLGAGAHPGLREASPDSAAVLEDNQEGGGVVLQPHTPAVAHAVAGGCSVQQLKTAEYNLAQHHRQLAGLRQRRGVQHAAEVVPVTRLRRPGMRAPQLHARPDETAGPRC